MNKDQKNQAIGEKVGIKWHKKIHSDNFSMHNFHCPCGYTCVLEYGEEGLEYFILKHLKENPNPDFFSDSGQRVLAKALEKDDMLLLEFDIWFKSLIVKGKVKPIDMFHINHMIAESSYTELFFEFMESTK